MNDLLNRVGYLSRFWLFLQTQAESKYPLAFLESTDLKKRPQPELISIATVTLPLFILCFAAEPAQSMVRKVEPEPENNHFLLNLTRQPVLNHNIKPGDTLWELSQKYQTSPQEIAQENEMTPQQLLQVGKTLDIPVTPVFSLQKPESESQVVLRSQLPVGGIGGAISSEESPFQSFAEETLISPIPLVIAQEKTNAREKNPSAGSLLPIQEFLADVKQLERNYEGTSLNRDPLQQDENPERENQGKFVSPVESSANDSSDNSLATAPIKVEFYNRFLNPSLGETVSPKLPPLSSPDQYLPNSPRKFNGYIWPAEGVFTSGYGRRWGRMHRGIDIAAPIGTPIVAAAPGEVLFAGWNNGGYGNLVKLRHPDGSLTLYAHNNKVLVRKGQEVDQGQQIAEMGNTGRSTGPHLHFEIHPSGKGAVNPLAYLPER